MSPHPSVTYLFESTLHSSDSAAVSTTQLDSLIRQKLNQLVSEDMDITPASTPPTPPSSDPGAILADMGDYFTRTAAMWSHLTESLMKGPHIDRATTDVHDRARAENRLSDLSRIATMDVQIGKLRKIKDMAAQFSREVQAVWQPETPQMMNAPLGMQSSISPFCDTAKSTSQSMSVSDGDPRAYKARKLLPESTPQAQGPLSGDGSGSDDSDDDDDDDEQFQRIDMDALRQRGKGSYYCPKGMRCDKGGVDKEGNLVLFDRNSSFAQHCNKHRKPWRCEVPGCPNPPKKRKFARRDGLERHKATVKHYIIT